MIKLADSNLWKSQGLIAGEWRSADSARTTGIRNPATNEPLRITDEKQKPIKYSIIAKSGYTAPREVE